MTARKPAKTEPAPTLWRAWHLRDEAIEELCDRVEGGESIAQIAESLGVPNSTVLRWIEADPQRSARATRAREKSARTWDEKAEQELRQAGDPFALSRAKELAQHYRWRASKIAPREYGDKLELGGEVGLKSLPDEQMKAEALKLMAKLGLSADATLLK